MSLITGTTDVNKNSLKNYVQNHKHKEAQSKETRNEVEQSVIASAPIGRGLKWMAEKDKKIMKVKFSFSWGGLSRKERAKLSRFVKTSNQYEQIYWCHYPVKTNC